MSASCQQELKFLKEMDTNLPPEFGEAPPEQLDPLDEWAFQEIKRLWNSRSADAEPCIEIRGSPMGIAGHNIVLESPRNGDMRLGVRRMIAEGLPLRETRRVRPAPREQPQTGRTEQAHTTTVVDHDYAQPSISTATTAEATNVETSIESGERTALCPTKGPLCTSPPGLVRGSNFNGDHPTFGGTTIR